MSCPSTSLAESNMATAQRVFSATTSCPRVRHLVSGTFNSNLLHILSFDTLTRTLSLLSSLPAYGPHSFLTPGRTSRALAQGRLVDSVYATTWAETTELCAWRVQWNGEHVDGLEWLGNVPITATSSYVHVQPPPYDSLTTPAYGVSAGVSRYLYAAGGPTGEVHGIDAETGALQSKTQEVVFLRGGEKDLAAADKTRKALRYGAHNVDIARNRLTYIADVGRNAILTYRQDPSSGSLSFLSETPLPAERDGPRHVVPSPCGRFAYCVSEHTSYVDVYAVDDVAKGQLRHVQRVSILPDGKHTHDYRGDTVRVSPDGRHLFATTRGMRTDTKGFVKVWRIDEAALEAALKRKDGAQEVLQETYVYETRNSGGKANAIEFAPRYADAGGAASPTMDFAVLTDDQQGFITVLEWDGHDLRDATTIQLPPLDNGEAQGASQAIWLS